MHIQAQHVAQSTLEKHRVRPLGDRFIQISFHQPQILERLRQPATSQPMGVAKRNARTQCLQDRQVRVGYGGTMGALTNIDQEGFASAAFHSFPDMLKFDPYSGDYGPNFFGHAINTATYVVHDSEFGWLAFDGNLKIERSTIAANPLDLFRTRVYFASSGLWLTLDAGRFSSVSVNPKTGAVRVDLDAATKFTPKTRLRVEQPAKLGSTGTYHPVTKLESERGAYVVLLRAGTTWVELQPQIRAPQTAFAYSYSTGKGVDTTSGAG